ncbi:c-type cytochrome [Roseibium sp. M-1]
MVFNILALRPHAAFSASLLAAIVLMPLQAAAETSCSSRSSLSEALKADPDLQWDQLRQLCSADIDRNRQADPVGHAWFVNGGNGFVGAPLVLMKLLPDLAPEIWGPPEEEFGQFGLFPDPGLPGRILPRGLGVTGSQGRPLDGNGNPIAEIDYSIPQPLFVTLSCGACHTGQVDLGDRTLDLEGAPNTQFDVRKWRGAFSSLLNSYLSAEQIGTQQDPGSTTKTLLDLTAAKPEGYFAKGLPQISPQDVNRVDAIQRQIFSENIIRFLQGLAQSSGVRSAAVVLQTRPGSSYGGGDKSPGLAGHSAGQSDGSGDLLADLIAIEAAQNGKLEELLSSPLPDALPRFATVTDAPSVWNQADRSTGQWDGSVLERFWRNIAAQLPIIGSPDKVDLSNAAIVAEYLLGLPSAPYPFDVDLAKAVRGEALFAENCGTCHRPRNSQRYPQIGTDMNRAQVLNAAGAEKFLQAFKAACHNTDFTYRDRDGREIRPCVAPGYQILRDTTETANQGYLAPPLDGIWARAPYLHNGSVPTLTQLLKPGLRPAEFLRGAISYDTDAVGWEWEADRLEELKARYPTVSTHDTSRDGWTNRGHDRDLLIEGKALRLDWSSPEHADEFEALLEYLKTL